MFGVQQEEPQMGKTQQPHGTTTAGTFRHLSEFRIEKADGGSWIVVEAATGKQLGRYKTFRGAFIKRKALIAGVPYNRARGLPA
jgi:hypothetical protein